jgi:hypothetical protein
MLGDLSTRSGAEEFVRWLCAKLREDFLESNELRPRAWVFVQRDPSTGEKLEQTSLAMVVVPDFRGCNEEKDALAAMIRELAVRSKAAGVAMAMEAWFSEGLTLEQANALGPRGLEALPEAQRLECLYLSLDHLAFERTRSWRATIRRDPDGRPLLDEFIELPMRRHMGRFSSVFPRELWQ